MSMQYLGVMRGSGTLACGGAPLGAADYDLDAYLTRPGEVVASGELRMPSAALTDAFGRRDLRLMTDDGRVLIVRFTGKRLSPSAEAAHVDVTGDLPTAKNWQR